MDEMQQDENSNKLSIGVYDARKYNRIKNPDIKLCRITNAAGRGTGNYVISVCFFVTKNLYFCGA